MSTPITPAPDQDAATVARRELAYAVLEWLDHRGMVICWPDGAFDFTPEATGLPELARRFAAEGPADDAFADYTFQRKGQ